MENFEISPYKGNNEKIHNIKFENEIINDKKQISEKLNGFFVESVENICSGFPQDNGYHHLSNIAQFTTTCSFKTISKVELLKVLNEVHSKTFFDNVNGRVLIDAFNKENFAMSFLELINQSLHRRLCSKFMQNIHSCSDSQKVESNASRSIQ